MHFCVYPDLDALAGLEDMGVPVGGVFEVGHALEDAPDLDALARSEEHTSELQSH